MPTCGIVADDAGLGIQRFVLLFVLMALSAAMGSCVTAIAMEGDLSPPPAPTITDLPGAVLWTPTLSAKLTAVDPGACQPALWLESMWPGFVFNKDVERTQPLTLRFALGNATGHVDADMVRFHAAWLYGLNIEYVPDDAADALHVYFNDEPTGYTAKGGPFEGVVDHDQVSLTYSKTNVQLLHTYYRIELWNSTHTDMVLLHELGHATGLGHVSNPGNIMRDGAAALGIQECSAWVLRHVHPTSSGVGWTLP